MNDITISKLRAENAQLKQDNAQLKRSICHLEHIIDQQQQRLEIQAENIRHFQAQLESR
jgi:cell division protein FtsB